MWLGHADPGFTLRTYVHLIDDGLGDADFLDGRVTAGNNATPNHAKPEPAQARKTAQNRSARQAPRGQEPNKNFAAASPQPRGRWRA